MTYTPNINPQDRKRTLMIVCNRWVLRNLKLSLYIDDNTILFSSSLHIQKFIYLYYFAFIIKMAFSVRIRMTYW